jgi:hypothetical protein
VNDLEFAELKTARYIAWSYDYGSSSWTPVAAASIDDAITAIARGGNSGYWFITKTANVVA